MEMYTFLELHLSSYCDVLLSNPSVDVIGILYAPDPDPFLKMGTDPHMTSGSGSCWIYVKITLICYLSISLAAPF